MDESGSGQILSFATFRYFGDLQKQLKRQYRDESIVYRFKDHPSVKDAIEVMGLPHTEVDVVLANGRSVPFNYQLQNFDTIDVYPVYTPVPAGPLLRLSPPPPEPVCFVLDVHLGSLARRLRLLGFDCLYQNNFSDTRIMQLAQDQQRIILTRDRGILRHRQIMHGYLVRSDRVNEQLQEVLARYLLYGRVRPWIRCMSCNGLLAKVEKSAVVDRLEPKTRLYYQDFRRCTSCDQLYWQGSHFLKLKRWLAELNSSLGCQDPKKVSRDRAVPGK